MIPVDFPEANLTLVAPAASTNVTPLRVWSDGRECISCWMLSQEQREKIAAGEPVYLCVMGGTMPPVWLDVGSPFTDAGALRESDAAALRELGIEP